MTAHKLVITARFASICPACDMTISAGDTVTWSRGEKAVHQTCPQRASALRLVPPPVAETNPWAAVAAAAASELAPSAPTVSEVVAAAPKSAPVASSARVPGADFAAARKPRQTVRRASTEDLAWDPEAMPLFTLSPDETSIIRAGAEFSILNPNVRRHPTGRATDYYRVYSHRKALEQTVAGCSESVSHRHSLIVGQGTRIVHDFDVRHLGASTVLDKHGRESLVTSRLTLVVPHTGREALSAHMTVYVDGMAFGSLIGATAPHVSSNPNRWQGEVDAMIERSIIVQDALLDLVRAAANRDLVDEDRKWLRRRGIVIKNSARTALAAMQEWHGVDRAGRAAPTWGVWSRRLDSAAIDTLCELLGRATYGKAIDDAMGLSRPRFGKI